MKTLALSSHLQASFQGYRVPKMKRLGTRELKASTVSEPIPFERVQERRYALTATMIQRVQEDSQSIQLADERARREMIRFLLKDLQDEIKELIIWSFEEGYDNDIIERLERLERFAYGEPVEETQ